MKRSFIARLAGGLVVLGLMAAAMTANTANADSPFGTPKPDLVVEVQKATCLAGNLSIKIRVQNTTNVPTASVFQTVVVVNGAVIPGAPVFVGAPLWNGQVFHFNIPATGYQQLVTAYADSAYQVAETNETNNGAFKVAWCS